ncbi:unnamed protein product, partial [Vitis vinifera]
MAGDVGSYIIHMDKSAMPMTFSSHHDWYMSTLSSISSPDGSLPTHLYTYNHVLDGFSAVLSKAHLDQLEKMPGHLATYPDSFGKLHTTHSPKFLGLEKNSGAWPEGKFGEDMIIGLKRRGLNVSAPPDDYDSPRDFHGHGTHTSSTAAGSPVRGANYFGYAEGTAIGISPKARLAMYKVIFLSDLTDGDAAASDTLAGMDQAIADGVDLMSLSLGFEETTFEQNPIAVGAFSAMEKGIFVSCSAGNSGPDAYTMFNGAPWITTIGAGTIDRDYAADVKLGNGILTVRGKSVYPENLLISNVSLYFGYGNRSKELCEYGALDPEDVAGKIVFCDIPESGGIQSYEVGGVEAAGAIFSSDSQNSFWPSDFDMPYVAVSPKDGDLVKDYIIKSQNPVVDIKFQITVLGAKPAPQVAEFSSRGPDEYLLSDYGLLSGTSMASPHAVGVAALLKAAHPDWSPAAIRSAMMTTAYLLDNTQGPIMDMTTGVAGTPLDFGAGHINPNMAMDPGLVYDIEAQDYINFLCGLNYTSKQIKIITRRSKFSCDQANLDLNYPSFMVLLNNTNTTSYTFKRVLTNVEDTYSVYQASVKQPSGMKVTVLPSTVSFTGRYSKAEFNMTVEINLGDAGPQSDYIGNYGYLTWREVNGTHVVRILVVQLSLDPFQPPKMECIPYKLLFLFLALSTSVAEDLGTYIIHMDKSAMPMTFSSHHDWYRSTLSSMSSPDGILPTHLYTYNHVLDGFSAVLSHMIIGILDSGIWPESESFKDKGMAPVPDRWRGACESGVEFNSSYCNRKLIGARSFSKGMKQRGLNISLPDDYDSPRDFLGHGTHTSDSSDPEAAASDTLAGMDQAIADGVDLMSLSLGFFETTFDENPIAVGAFAAMEKGIFVSCSAGNAGPHGYTIFNGAPWITTIGAGTIDRDYAADVTLGNGILRVRGKSVYPEDVIPIPFIMPVYICDLLQRAGLSESKLVTSPMAVGHVLSIADGTRFEDPTLYRSLVGALQYCTITRPDIAYTINKFFQFMHAPTSTHLQAVKRVLRYLKGSLFYGLSFQPSSSLDLIAYTDADGASCPDDRRSTNGYCIFFRGNLISWSASKQKVVSRSSIESKYRGLANATIELTWIQSLLKELFVPLFQPPVLFL